jgi:membrane protein YqaA with SNARE-associated domain
MKNNNTSAILSPEKSNETPSKIRTLLFILEVCLVLSLLIIWFSSDSIRNSKYLWGFLFYSFPSNFLIAVVPHEPVILYFGEFYSPLIVAFVAIAGTLPTEAINYTVFRYVADLRALKKIRQSKVVELFKRKPFIALLIAGFTPLPFYPFRFLVVFAHYPIWKYLLAVFLSRTPRYFIIAYVGYAFKIPPYLLIATFIVLLLAVNAPIVIILIRKKKKKKPDAA